MLKIIGVFAAGDIKDLDLLPVDYIGIAYNTALHRPYDSGDVFAVFCLGSEADKVKGQYAYKIERSTHLASIVIMIIQVTLGRNGKLYLISIVRIFVSKLDICGIVNIYITNIFYATIYYFRYYNFSSDHVDVNPVTII